MAGLDPAIQVVSSKELMRRTAAIFVENCRLDGRGPAIMQEGDSNQFQIALANDLRAYRIRPR